MSEFDQKFHVVIQTAFIGDLYLSIPFLKHLKKINPNHQIILVCKKGLGAFFLKEGIVSEVLDVQKGQSKSYRLALKTLKPKSIDHVYCLHRSVRSALFVGQITANKKFSFVESKSFFNWRKLIFSDLVVFPKKWPEVIRQMSLLTPVDKNLKTLIDKKDWIYLNFSDPQNKFEKIPFEFSFQNDKETLNKNTQKKIALFPGSVWATKKWTLEGFTELARLLINENYEVYLMGGPDDFTDSKLIKDKVPNVHLKTGQMSLLESSYFIKDFDLIICNDSAPAHIAAYFQRPVLALFGPTVLDFGFRPWQDNSRVIQEKLDCRPCGPHGHQKCPLGHHDCMKKISAYQVFLEARKMLGE